MDKFFEILPHKADLQIKVYGSSKEELLVNSMKAMFEATGTKGNSEKIFRSIEISAPTFEQLLIDFLNEIIYLSEVEGEMYSQIKFEKFSDNYLKCQLIGCKIAKRELLIKGVTYHNFKIEKKNNRWEATILFDV